MEEKKELSVYDLVKLGKNGLQEHIIDMKKEVNKEEDVEEEVEVETYEDVLEEKVEEEKEEVIEEVEEKEEVIEEVEEKEEVIEEVEKVTQEGVVESIGQMTNDFLNGKKVKVKFNKSDIEIDGEQAPELIQKGLAFESKSVKFKDALEIDTKLKNANISKKDLDAFIKFKSDPEDGLKDFVALNGLDTQNMIDKLYEVDESDIKSRNEAYDNEIMNYNPIVAEILPTISDEIQSKSIENFRDIPGLEQFSNRAIGSKDVNTFNKIVELIEDGSFDKVKSSFINKYVKLDEVSKNKLLTDDTFFVNLYDSVAKDFNQPVETATNNSVNQQNNKVSLKDKKEKGKFGKPNVSQPTTVEKKQQSKDDIIKNLVKIGLENPKRFQELKKNKFKK